MRSMDSETKTKWHTVSADSWFDGTYHACTEAMNLPGGVLIRQMLFADKEARCDTKLVDGCNWDPEASEFKSLGGNWSLSIG